MTSRDAGECDFVKLPERPCLRWVRCEHCGVKKVGVPWARPGSGFTLLFEAMIMAMVPAMPVKAVARMVGEHDTRLWRVIHHDVVGGQGQGRIRRPRA